MELNEARRRLDESLGSEELVNQYVEVLRRYFTFKSPITFEEAYEQTMKLLTTPEQIECHNDYFLALRSKPSTETTKATQKVERHHFEPADCRDYIQEQSSSDLPPPEYMNRSAAAELFVPNAAFVASKVALVAWDCKIDGADSRVNDLMVHACQTFMRNIITAMIAKLRPYKVRDGKFYYGFNTANPNPFLYNFKNVAEPPERTPMVDEEGSLVPTALPGLQSAELETAFAYGCTKRMKCDNVLSLKLLYETLRDNPTLLGSREMQNMGLFKLGLLLDP